MVNESAVAIRARVAALRAELARRDLDGFIIPRADEFQGEYVPPHAERLAWLTGFTGSAGAAVIRADRAAMFVDGRYTLQVRHEVPEDLFQYRHVTEEPITDWLITEAPKGARIGYDPWLHGTAWVERAEKALGEAGITLEPCATNPVDAIWGDQPPPPAKPIVRHPIAYSGRESIDKREEIAAELRRKGADALVLAQPDSVAWLLNIRGDDVPCSPLPLAFAILDAEGHVSLFADDGRVPAATRAHMGDAVTVAAPETFVPALRALGAEGAGGKGAVVMVDPAVTARRIIDELTAAGAELKREADPCALPKACKNAVELDGARAAHRRDGVALARFLAWFDGVAPKGDLTELAVVERIAAFRAEGALHVGPSFETIAGAGPNGAIVHYRVTRATDRRLEPGSLFLLDSGAQYLDGTTDVTRTLAVGTPSEEARRHFTLVLRGHIALASVRFPKGTTGSQLDALARAPLWSAGLDYDHGTGHGVGSFLSVHEGPQRISKVGNTVALLPGMVLSNEPGYYKSGSHGIRIENLQAVREAGDLYGADRPMLEFESLTLAPIDRKLIDVDGLNAAEIAWLDAYHARVRDVVGPALDAEAARWLDAATAPLTGDSGNPTRR